MNSARKIVERNGVHTIVTKWDCLGATIPNNNITLITYIFCEMKPIQYCNVIEILYYHCNYNGNM